MSSRPPAEATSDGAGEGAKLRERTIVVSAMARVEGEGALDHPPPRRPRR